MPQAGRRETGGWRDSRQVGGSEALRWLIAPSTSRKDSELSQLTLRMEDEQLLGTQLQKKIKELQVCGAQGGWGDRKGQGQRHAEVTAAICLSPGSGGGAGRGAGGGAGGPGPRGEAAG